MCAPTEQPESERGQDRPERARVRARLEKLVAQREAAELRRTQLTTEIHGLLRDAHDAGWSWAEIAEFAGYRSADAARNQATPVASRPSGRSEPTGSYSVREAAELLGVSPQTVYAWVASGRIKAADSRKSGRRVYLPADRLPQGDPSS